MSTEIDVAMLTLRVGAGIVMLAHGVKHARGREKTSRWFGSIGFRAPQLQWFLSTATEIGVGLLLIAGAITSLAVAGMIGILTVAFWTVHRVAGFWITARPDEGWEYVFVLALVGSAVAIIGPGDASIDAALGIADELAGGVGAVLAAAGIVAAFGQMAIFWRPAPAVAGS
jgi:putative oxidoreductase